MVLPDVLISRFPPSPTRLFDLARAQVNDSMLWEIANADYGNIASETFAELLQIRNDGVIPTPMSNHLDEAITLTRWCQPERLNQPLFQPGPTGITEHKIRIFACAVIMRADSEPATRFRDIATDSTIANCLVSAGILGDDFNEALASFLTCQYRCSDDPMSYGLALLTIVLRLQHHLKPVSALSELVGWILALDSAHSSLHQGFEEPEPLPFSLMQGHWQPIAREIKERAATIKSPALREDVQLCAVLLHAPWAPLD